MIALLPKKEQKINAVTDVMFAYVTILCVTSLLAFLINLLGVPINLLSMGGIYLSLGIFALIFIAGKKNIQHHIIRKIDVISVALLVSTVGIMMLFIFTPYIHFNYYNQVDPCNHFLYASDIVHSEKLGGMFFNSLYNAMFMELLTWAVPPSWLYKAFILSDIYHLILELIFFYACIVASKEKMKKYTPLAWSMFYWWSFLLFSFLWGFIYWSMAVMLVQYVILLIKFQEEHKERKKMLWALMGVGVFAITMCYIEFTPGIVLTLLAIIIYNNYIDGKIKWNIANAKYLVMIAILFVIVMIVGYHYVFQDRGITFLDALKMGKQQNIGLELVLMLPLVLIIILRSVREKRKLTVLQLAYLANVSVQILYTILAICHVISTYYLQKTFFILFFLSIVVILEGCTAWSRKMYQYIGIAALSVLCFFVLSYDGDDSKTFSLQQSTLIQNLSILSEHNFSEGTLSDNGKIYLMQYAMEEMGEENESIPLIISTPINRGIGSWLEATYRDSSFIWLEDIVCTEEQMTSMLQSKNATHFIIFFDDLLYIYDLHDYFDSFERVYRNDAGFIGEISWE
ncbi:MAG: hypothetical protein IJO65_01490 [Lachnospiraceae bacterium]|nr:hypothetical protein [Lachnospiraceae bacterium]